MDPGDRETADPLRNFTTSRNLHRDLNVDTTATMTNLDMLLLKGASTGITEENLAELRYTILTKGIPANSEGMVSTPKHDPFYNSSTPSIATTSPISTHKPAQC